MNKKYLPLLSIIPAIIFISLHDGISFSDSVQTSSNGYIHGHLAMEVKDQYGITKYYNQGDNVIVNNGENCASKLLFQAVPAAAGNSVCAGANTVGFRYIGLDESNTAVAETDGGLNDPADSAGLSTPLFGTITWTNSTGTSSNAQVVIAATFTNSGASETIYGAGLFNSTTTSQGMFAHKLAASPATVDTTDTLTATWTITIGGT